MVANKKVTGNAATMPVGIGMGVLVSTVITCIFAALLAWLILGERLAESMTGYSIMLILLIASTVGAAVAARKVKHRHMFVCMISGGCYFAVLLASTALFFGGQYDGVVVTMLLVLGGSAVAGIQVIKGKGRRKISRRKNYIR